MAKDDFHVIVYQILSYLYNCLKKGEKVDTEKLERDSDLFVTAGRPLSETYWGYVLYQMKQMGLIVGIKFSGHIDDSSIPKPSTYCDCMITPAGIEYLTDSVFLNKVKGFSTDESTIEPLP